MIVGVGTYGHEQINVHDWGQNTNLYIGKYCSIADKVTVLLGGNHNLNRVTTYPFGVKLNIGPNKEPDCCTNGNVVIGNDVWVGHNVTIMSGVTIGDGSVIAACSVVTKDVEPYSIVGGNPCKIIRKRFTDEQIKQLLEIKWWNWDIQKIKAFGTLLLDPDINEFIRRAKQ